VNKLLPAIEKVHLVALTQLDESSLPSLLNCEMGQSFRDDSDVRSPRFDTGPKMLIKCHVLERQKFSYALPAELACAAGCGRMNCRIEGRKCGCRATSAAHHRKGGRYRPVPISEELLSQLNRSKQYLFTLLPPGEQVPTNCARCYKRAGNRD